MPKSFDAKQLHFFVGEDGSDTAKTLEYSVEGNTIVGSYSEPLKPYEGITIRLFLPNGYFTNPYEWMSAIDPFSFIIPFIFLLLTIFLWYKYGNDRPVIETVEFYPPEGFNSAEIGVLYSGYGSSHGVISLLIYLADKGYIKIEETKEKVLFVDTKSYTITKLKPYDGVNEKEKIFMDNLFIDGDTVKKTDLEKNFHTTVSKINQKLSKDVKIFKIFEPLSLIAKWLTVFMTIITFFLIVFRPVTEYYNDYTWPIVLTTIIAIASTVINIFSNNGFANIKSPTLRFIIPVSIIFLIMALISIFAFSAIIMSQTYIYAYLFGAICIIIMLSLSFVMSKRTPYGNEMLGKIKGFKRFLEEAEKPKLEELVNQDPQYFYHILPYTYVLGVSSIWVKKFESIAMEPPSWYVGPGVFSVHDFGHFVNTTVNSAAISNTASSASGGGGAGGGSGGGGGGSW